MERKDGGYDMHIAHEEKRTTGTHSNKKKPKPVLILLINHEIEE